MRIVAPLFKSVDERARRMWITFEMKTYAASVDAPIIQDTRANPARSKAEPHGHRQAARRCTSPSFWGAEANGLERDARAGISSPHVVKPPPVLTVGSKGLSGIERPTP
jgi:hypothetical protein